MVSESAYLIKENRQEPIFTKLKFLKSFNELSTKKWFYKTSQRPQSVMIRLECVTTEQ